VSGPLRELYPFLHGGASSSPDAALLESIQQKSRHGREVSER
jgi:hypothetical protein